MKDNSTYINDLIAMQLLDLQATAIVAWSLKENSEMKDCLRMN